MICKFNFNFGETKNIITPNIKLNLQIIFYRKYKMCQSINQYENNNIIFEENDTEESDTEESDTEESYINSSKYQYIDSQEEGEELDFFDFNEDFIRTISSNTNHILIEFIDTLNEDYEFNDDIDECNHEQIDSMITHYSNKFCEIVLNEYGIIKGIKEFTDEFGELLNLENDNWIKQVIYVIFTNNMICRIEEVNDENRDVNKIKSYLRKIEKI